MPLNTEIIGLKGPTDIIQPEGGWDYAALGCFLTAALSETEPDLEISAGHTVGQVEAEGRFVDFSWSPVYYFDVRNPLWHSGTYKLKKDHTFVLSENRTITFKQGYTFRMWRSYK